MTNPNPRKGSYGYSIRIGTPSTNLTGFTDITVIASASANVSTITWNLSAGSLSVGASTVQTSAGDVLTSGEYVILNNLSATAKAFVTADEYRFVIHASGSNQNFISQPVLISVDT